MAVSDSCSNLDLGDRERKTMKCEFAKRMYAWRLVRWFLALNLLPAIFPVHAQEVSNHRLADIRVRDPFILADPPTKLYYLVTSMQRPPGAAKGISVFTSKDLENWAGPVSVFDVPPDCWAHGEIWAPEMHAYHGKYYLFTTFNADVAISEPWPKDLPRVRRGSVILVADSPLGPFKQMQNRPHTPANQLALDATLWVENGDPYMIYCHEWLQIKDGTIDCIRLTPDLYQTQGEPFSLFKGSDASWTPRNRPTYVTDGPYLFRTKTGTLLMIWSSYLEKSYATGIAVSASGRLKGPWTHEAKPLFAQDGGHGMIFRKFDGTLMLVLHQPNEGQKERAHLFELEDTGDCIRFKAH